MEAVIRSGGVNSVPLLSLKENQVPIGFEHYWLAGNRHSKFSLNLVAVKKHNLNTELGE
jgi:hypothetical protein